MMALHNQSRQEQTREEVHQTKPSEAGLKENSLGLIAADYQATSLSTEEKKMTENRQCQAKKPKTNSN